MEDGDIKSSAESSESNRRKQPHRRAPRACDECRLRKSKCDGLQPCEPCQVSDRYCAYNLVPGKSTGPGARVRILEDRLRRARVYLNEFQRRVPDLATVDFDSLLGSQDDLNTSEPRPQPHYAAQAPPSYTSQKAQSNHVDSSEEPEDDLRLDSMMNAYGRMELSDPHKSNREFYGAASGLAFLHRTQTYFEERGDDEASQDEAQDSAHSAMVQLFDSPLPQKQALNIDVPIPQLLPRRSTADALVQIVLGDVYLLFDFLNEEVFYEKLNRIYELEPIQYDDEDHNFLPLLYAVLGVGYVFSRSEHRKHGCTGSLSQAMRHFVAARNMVDVTNCRDLQSLQVLVCFILFLVSTARLASAHAYVGLAVASAMRQGLHFRSTYEASYTAFERNNRRRIFWSVVKADMYVSKVLGLPSFIDLSDVDPAIDLTLEHAMKEARESLHVSQYQFVLLAASAKHIEIKRIIAKAAEALYPKPPEELQSDSSKCTISVSISKLRSVEEDFHTWGRSAAKIFPEDPTSERIMNLKYELEMIYYFGQIILYRPFLHYLAVRDSESTAAGRRQLKCAMACIKVAMNIISRSETTLERGCLAPASWTSLYTIFLAVVCLIFLVATQKDGPIPFEARKKVKSGARILATVACSDSGAAKCLGIVKMLLTHVSTSLESDLEKIEQDAVKFCYSSQPESPVSQQIEMSSEVPNLTAMFGGEHASNLTNVPSSWGTGFPQSWDMNDLSMSPSFNSGVLGQQDGFQNTQPQFGFYGHPEFQESQLQNAEEAMEIPYVPTFSWPHQPDVAAMPSLGSPTSNHAMSTHSLSPEDIAAFMRISPHQKPFI